MRLPYSKIIILSLIVIAICLLYYFHFSEFVTISYIYQHLHEFKKIINDHYIISVLFYLLIYCIVTALCIPGSSLFTIAGGMLFGNFAAIFYALLGAICGSTVLFLLSRYLVGNWIQFRYSEQLVIFNEEIKYYGRYYLLVMRLLGVLPFGIITILSSMTILPLKQFIFMTFVGIFPITCFYVHTGITFSSCQNFADLYSPSIVRTGIFFIIVKLLLLPLAIKIIRNRSKKRTLAAIINNPT